MINTKTIKTLLIGALLLSAGCTISTGSNSSSVQEIDLLKNIKQLTVRSYDGKINKGTSYDDAVEIIGRDCDEKTFDKDEKLFYCDFSEEGVKDSSETNDVGLVFTKNNDEIFELTYLAYDGPDLPEVRSVPDRINRNNYSTYLKSKENYPNLEIGVDLFVDKSAYVTLDRLTDGDTADFKVFGSYEISDDEIIQKHQVESTRFLGVDTPETHHPTYGIQPWGNAGKQYTSDRLTEAINIVLELDFEVRETYGRLLAYVWVDGILLPCELLEMGIANPRYVSRNTYFDELAGCYFKRDEWQKVINLKDPNWDYESPNYSNNTCTTYNCEKNKNYRYNFTYGF